MSGVGTTYLMGEGRRVRGMSIVVASVGESTPSARLGGG